MIYFLFAQFALIAFNLINVLIDAYVILKDKSIAHGVNGISYILFTGIIGIFFGLRGWELVLLFPTSFFNRQLSFDIPLNLRRGLKWYYQSEDNPPKAVMDRIERIIFGDEPMIGKKIVHAYLIFYCICINIDIWLIR